MMREKAMGYEYVIDNGVAGGKVGCGVNHIVDEE